MKTINTHTHPSHPSKSAGCGMSKVFNTDLTTI